MKRVTGIGGIFFKSASPEKLYEWYEKHLGITRGPDGSGAMFEWRDAQNVDKKGLTIWSIFPRDTKYFGSSNSALMINYRVDDLNALLKRRWKQKELRLILIARTANTGALPGSRIRMGLGSNFGSRLKNECGLSCLGLSI